MSVVEQATEALDAFARSDIERARALCAENVVLFGTDVGESWTVRETFLAALDDMRALGLSAHWRESPAAADDWVAGEAESRFPDGRTLPVRVTLIFAGRRLVHGHYSVASEVIEANP